jgi:hypothetical protein
MCSSKKGISAYQIHREFGMSYKNAWFMAHRIRFAMTDKNPGLLSGIVEADETYIGGKPRGHWAHRKGKERSVAHLESRKRRTPVFGIKERGGNVRAHVIPHVTKRDVEKAVTDNIDRENARLMTDEAPVYWHIERLLPHGIIQHKSEYVRGEVHTQSIESFWAQLKRGLTSTYHHVDQGYLNQYVQEFAFRHNTRKITDTERFNALLANVSGRVDWYLTSSEGEPSS